MDEKILRSLYLEKMHSVAKIATALKCSQNKVNFWLSKFNIQKRTISDAIYISHNGTEDPFKLETFNVSEKSFLLGLGVGLYWGEGNKANKFSIKLGNTDPDLILCFIKFLKVIYGIRADKLKFGLQIFSDIDPAKALAYWKGKLKVNADQFQKPTVSKVRGIGTYKYKSLYGVLTVYFNNKKLRDILIKEIEKLRIV